MIHNRDATQDCIDILLEEHAEEVGGIMHSFSGSPEIADVVTQKTKLSHFTWWPSNV